MSAPSNTALLNFTDSVAKALSDFNGIVVASSMTSGASGINAGISGFGTTNTLGRIQAYADPTSELALLSPMNADVTKVAAYLTGLAAMNPFYLQLFDILNAFDNYISANVQTGGVNAWLAANSLQVNAWYALAHNYFQTLAVPSYRSSATIPTAIANANFFPYANVAPMITWTCGTGSASPSITAGSATSTQGGGVGPLVIYKTNASNAIGGATFTITYTNAAGSTTATTTYSTTAGVPTASGSVSSGDVSLGVTGSAVTNVTETGGTSGEIYAIGIALVRSPAY